MADKTIMVVVDPTATDPQPVIDRAAWLAERVAARLELCIFDFDADIDAGQVSTVWIPEPARDNLIASHRRKVESLAEPLRVRGLEVSAEVIWDHPLGEAITRRAIALEPWLVAKDTHHHSVLKRTLLSNTDWHLIRGCPAPLLLVKSRTLAAKPKVFAAVDPLHEHDKPARLDHNIFELAETLASSISGELHVVHAFSPPMGIELPPDVADAIASQHRSAMAEFLASHRVPAANVHLLPGPPPESLRRMAEHERADFVVMGAVSRRGLSKLFIGSTAERILDHLPCDLVIVKPENFEPALPHSD
jgi:universal stress protein E